MLLLLKQLSVRLLVDRRVPNIAPFSFGNTSFKVVQYNGRGVLLADHHARQLAGKNIKNLALSAHVLCLEEVHGHAQEIENILALWLPGWRIFASSALRADGTQVMVRGVWQLHFVRRLLLALCHLIIVFSWMAAAIVLLSNFLLTLFV